jgi:hypothetical protein
MRKVKVMCGTAVVFLAETLWLGSFLSPFVLIRMEETYRFKGDAETESKQSMSAHG